MSKEKEIFNYLFELNVCKRCCLRYICVRNQDVYDNINEYVLEKNYLSVEQINAAEEICIVCLGLLQNSTLNDVVSQIQDSSLVKEYDSNTFSCSVSYPASIQIREHAIRLHLDEKFPDFYTFDIQETMLNKTWKWSIKNKISSALKKEFIASETTNFSINVLTNYSLDEEELQVLLKMLPDYFTKRQEQKRKFKGEIFSRKGVTNVLSQIPTGVFKLQGDLPPKKAFEKVSCQGVECFHTSIFIAGRYNKYSRKLPQTPWILNGIRMLESSVQEVIFEPFHKELNIPEDGLKFSSSGREDVDVRCLGTGRPFYIEYLNPKKTQITFEEFRRIEKEINKSQNVKVRYLQLVKREELVNIKHGEESKTKQYDCICYITKGIFTDNFIKDFNTKAPIVLQQKTPLRVLHRRALAVREKIIHSANIMRIPGYENVIKLRVITQAGTYVKEFIHGDFGRTIPNLDLFGDKTDIIDIIALDVTAVNLDWPLPV